MTQLRFAGAGFRTVRPVEPSEVEQPDPGKAAHQAVTAAEGDLLAEYGRPSSREGWSRLATAYEKRATAWRHLAEIIKPDAFGHASRAMGLAADADMARARMLRERLGVTG